MNQDIIYPFHRPLYIMAKPASSMCNMRCRYCYYLEKSKYYPSHDKHIMSDETLEIYIRDYIAAQNSPHVIFNWHGGEAMICGIEFFKKAISLQKKYGEGFQIINTIQTNGLLITHKWCEFFSQNNFLVGISLDGPKDLHDHYRRTCNGESAYMQTIKGLNLLQRHNVEFNVLCTVNRHNASHGIRIYEHFKSLGVRFMQFIPIVERIKKDGSLALPTDDDGEIAPWCVDSLEWGHFMCDIFFHWIKKDVGERFVSFIDGTLAGYVGVDPGNCRNSSSCGHAMSLEYNGDVYSCDHYVFPEYLLGNIHHTHMRELSSSALQMRFAEMKLKSLPIECIECPYLKLCYGECPKTRIHTSASGGKISHLCEGYKLFFQSTAREFQFMASELKAGRDVSNVMFI